MRGYVSRIIGPIITMNAFYVIVGGISAEDEE